MSLLKKILKSIGLAYSNNDNSDLQKTNSSMRSSKGSLIFIDNLNDDPKENSWINFCKFYALEFIDYIFLIEGKMVYLYQKSSKTLPINKIEERFESNIKSLIYLLNNQESKIEHLIGKSEFIIAKDSKYYFFLFDTGLCKECRIIIAAQDSSLGALYVNIRSFKQKLINFLRSENS